jgi:hypothetical protein
MAKQMLLDTYTLKTGLSSLLPAPAPASFVKRVNNSFAKIETLLKTLQVQPSPPEALVQAYLIHIADRNNANFRKILDLKGIRSRQEQNHLVELFQVHRTSDRYASNIQECNPILAAFQTSSTSSSASVSQGLGLANLSTSAVSASNLPSRFDASTLGSALFSAARDGVDRLGTPMSSSATPVNPTASSAGTSVSPVTTPGPSVQTQSQVGDVGSNLNENLKNLGKFFRRDLGFGGRFGRGGDDG